MIFHLLLKRVVDKTSSKPLYVHVLTVVAVVLYAIMGGYIFSVLESPALERQIETEMLSTQSCVLNALQTESSNVNRTTRSIIDCFPPCSDGQSWTLPNAILFGFGVITTLGMYGDGPVTVGGRLFCVAFGLCGIPLALLLLANFGKFLNEIIMSFRKRLDEHIKKTRAKQGLAAENDDKENEVTSLIVVTLFLTYVALGAAWFPIFNGYFDFVEGLYYTFLALSAVEFSTLVPHNLWFVPIAVVYVLIGLSLTAVAIEVLSDYVKKLHYFGRKIANTGSTKIWFGGKMMHLDDLLEVVGDKLGVDPALIQDFLENDLDRVVDKAIAVEEGRSVSVTPEPSDNGQLECEIKLSTDRTARMRLDNLLRTAADRQGINREFIQDFIRYDLQRVVDRVVSTHGKRPQRPEETEGNRAANYVRASPEDTTWMRLDDLLRIVCLKLGMDPEFMEDFIENDLPKEIKGIAENDSASDLLKQLPNGI